MLFSDWLQALPIVNTIIMLIKTHKFFKTCFILSLSVVLNLNEKKKGWLVLIVRLKLHGVSRHRIE